MKVGDYVRTPKGIIAKIINIQEDTGQYFLNGNAVSLESKNYIADKNITIGENFKHSPNIVDLIEVGDYVNGCPVLHKEENEVVCGLLLRYKEENIQNVVTKEQFESMEYKVGE